MADYCVKCGDCCEIAFLPWTKTDMRRKLIEGDFSSENSQADVKFILKYWTRLNKKESHDRLYEIMGYHTSDKYLYTCQKFNRETRECEAYDERPPVCSNFPWYGNEPDDGSGLPLKCSYKQEYVEVPVELSTAVIR